jgi:hypothetical protein
MIPDECKMPDISDLDYPLIISLFPQLIVGEPGVTRKEGLYRRNFIRLMDKAIKEYLMAREAIIAQIEEGKRPEEEMIKGRIFYIWNFTDHFENCINTLNRLLKQLESIKSEPDSWEISRTVRRSIDSHSRAIPDIRNTIEHLAEQIQLGCFKDNLPVMLSVSENDDRVVLGEHEIRFDEVVGVIRGLHQVAIELLKSKPQN